MGWTASLELGFSADRGATRLAHRAHRGPFLVQRPFLPEGPEICHVYLLHPPGGLVGGDELRLDLRVGPAARALVTTPAAGKAYRTRGATARQSHALTIEAGGALEWLPQETIVYDGAVVELETRIDLAPGASFFGAETLCFGLPARGEPFSRGSCRQAFELWSKGQPIFVERGRFEGGAPVHREHWGLGGMTVMTLLAASPAPDETALASLRTLIASSMDCSDRAAATVIGRDDVLVVRHLSDVAERSRTFVQAVWRLLRPTLLGRPAIAPRIWAT